jgi:Tfp pilus assembly protein PilE
MGQQQLLLIILGVIIVGIAVAVGINMFTASASSSNRDAVSADLQNLAAMAQQYFRRPASMGGGNQSFLGWTIPAQLDTNANGTYAITATDSSTYVVITGTGTEVGNDGSANVQVKDSVWNNNSAITVVN